MDADVWPLPISTSTPFSRLPNRTSCPIPFRRARTRCCALFRPGRLRAPRTRSRPIQAAETAQRMTNAVGRLATRPLGGVNWHLDLPDFLAGPASIRSRWKGGRTHRFGCRGVFCAGKASESPRRARRVSRSLRTRGRRLGCPSAMVRVSAATIGIEPGRRAIDEPRRQSDRKRQPADAIDRSPADFVAMSCRSVLRTNASSQSRRRDVSRPARWYHLIPCGPWSDEGSFRRIWAPPALRYA